MGYYQKYIQILTLRFIQMPNWKKKHRNDQNITLLWTVTKITNILVSVSTCTVDVAPQIAH